MNKKVDEQFNGIKDVYVLRCICTELNNQVLQRDNLIKKVINYIKDYCIDDEFYINLTNKEKSIVDLLTLLENWSDEHD